MDQDAFVALQYLEDRIKNRRARLQAFAANDPRYTPLEEEMVEIARDMMAIEAARRQDKIEAMLAFILKKNVLEGRQRPTPAEAAVLGAHVSNFVTTHTWLDLFESEYAAIHRQPKG